MRNDLISREVAITTMRNYATPDEATVFEAVLRNVPTVDAEPVRHGHVIETIENGKFKRIFSCCGTDFTTMTMWMSPRYCPHCGAKMDGDT